LLAFLHACLSFPSLPLLARHKLLQCKLHLKEGGEVERAGRGGSIVYGGFTGEHGI